MLRYIVGFATTPAEVAVTVHMCSEDKAEGIWPGQALALPGWGWGRILFSIRRDLWGHLGGSVG